MNKIKLNLNEYSKKYLLKNNRIKLIKKNCKLLKFKNNLKKQIKNKNIKITSMILKNMRILNIF